LYVWSVYAVVECAFSTLLTRSITPSMAYAPLHPGLLVLLFVLYPLLGACLSAASAVLLALASRRLGWFSGSGTAGRARSAALLALILVFDLSAVRGHGLLDFSRGPHLWQLILALSLPLGAGQLWAAHAPIRSRRWRCLLHPVLVATVLVGVPWTTSVLLRGRGLAWVALGAALFLAAVALGAELVQRGTDVLKRRRRAGWAWLLTTPRAVLLGVMLSALLVADVALFHESTASSGDWGTHGPAAESATSTPGPALILLITMDTVRADHTSLYGYRRQTTPFLEELARQATRYRRAASSSDLTLSTHASIFTGLYATQHGAHHDGRSPLALPLSPRFRTLAEILCDHGYATAAVVANSGYLAREFGMAQGFSHYDSRWPVHLLESPGPGVFLRDGLVAWLSRWAPSLRSQQLYRRAGEINRNAFALLGRVAERPGRYFLFLNYMDAHHPYLPPPPFDTRFPGSAGGFDWSRFGAWKDEVMSGRRDVQEKERQYLIAHYDGGIAYIDSQLRALVAQLRKLGLYENSLLIVTSDHGEAFGERRLLGHGVSVYQDQTRVPLLIKAPGQRHGRVVDRWASSVDLLPTVLAFAGLPLPHGLPGRDLLHASPPPLRPVVSESFPWKPTQPWEVRFDRIQRVIHMGGDLELVVSTQGDRELYDLGTDPDEQTNLAAQDAAAAEKLARELDAWLAGLAPGSGGGKGGKALSAQTLDRLRALGYVR